MRKIFVLFVLGFLLFCTDKKNAKIIIKGKVLEVEIADTPKKIEKGLMFRKNIPENYGMLFIFEKPQILYFWMKNTSIPLSIAFINENLEIIQIEDMYPYDVVNIHQSIKPAKYALEVNQNWFKKNNIKVSDKIEIIWH